MKKLFDKSYLREELELPFNSIERKNEGPSGRWTDSVRIIFREPDQNDGTAWMTWYDTGKTEMQEGFKPWEYEDQVECFLVRKKEVVIEQWEEVDE